MILALGSCSSLKTSMDKIASDFKELGDEFMSTTSSSSTSVRSGLVQGSRGSSNAESLLRNKYRPETDLSNRNLISLGSLGNETQQKLLLRFIKEKNLEGVKNAIQLGANPNYGLSENEINHPLYTAIYWGQFHQSSSTVLGRGGNEAAEYYKIAEYLLTIVSDKNAVPSNFNHSSLFIMCRGSVENCKKCVEQWGFDVNKGHPYMFSSGGEMGEYLITKGLDIKYYDIRPTGYSLGSLKLLANQESFKSRVHLIEEGFLLKCDDKDGLPYVREYLKAGLHVDTDCAACLYDAIYENDADMVELLISNNANINPQNSCRTGSSKSPLQLALDRNCDMKIINALMQAGAK